MAYLLSSLDALAKYGSGVRQDTSEVYIVYL